MSAPRRNSSSTNFRERRLPSSISSEAPPTLPPDRHLTTAHAIWAKHPTTSDTPGTSKSGLNQKITPSATAAWGAHKSSSDRMKEFALSYTSELEKSRLHQKTSEGDVVAEDSGDWLLLDMPPQSRSANPEAGKKIPGDDIDVDSPETKNGITGPNGPRASKSLVRRLKNILISSASEPRLERDLNQGSNEKDDDLKSKEGKTSCMA